MANLNKVLLIGRLTREVDLRSLPSGQEVANFGLAINRTYMAGPEGARERREETTFVDCECWGRRAGPIAKYFSKGDPIFIEGRLKFETWDDKQTGAKRSKLLVSVENWEFASSRGGGGGQESAPVGAASGGGGGDLPPDDIPF